MNDREALFLRLVRENETRLRKICRVYARDIEAREDLYQDILVQLWRSLPSFEGNAAASTWLYRVALNTALSAQRGAAGRRETPLDAADEAHPVWRDGRPPADEHLVATERLERLYAAIDRLSDIDKALVTLYLEERSYHEMADVLGLSESHVGVKLHRIKKALAAWLAEEGEDPV
jgi:RNA polymerase sigma-70 factor (ECF subfamily)